MNILQTGLSLVTLLVTCLSTASFDYRSHPRGIESIQERTVSIGIRFHSSCEMVLSSSSVRGFLASTFNLRIPHKFSIGFKGKGKGMAATRDRLRSHRERRLWTVWLCGWERCPVGKQSSAFSVAAPMEEILSGASTYFSAVNVPSISRRSNLNNVETADQNIIFPGNFFRGTVGLIPFECHARVKLASN